jgi:hypothetical protein
MQHMAPTGPQQPSMVPLGCTYLRVLPWCLGRVGGPCCRSDWVLACLLPCCRLVPGLWPVAGLQSGCCVGLWLGAGLCFCVFLPCCDEWRGGMRGRRLGMCSLLGVCVLGVVAWCLVVWDWLRSNW